jgi:hypothetical protein
VEKSQSASHPVVGATILTALPEQSNDENEKSRSSGFEVALLTPPYRACAQWLRGAFVARYSGATARDSHPIPYSPPAVAGGTHFAQKPQHMVFASKNYTTNRVSYFRWQFNFWNFFRPLCSSENEEKRGRNRRGSAISQISQKTGYFPFLQ